MVGAGGAANCDWVLKEAAAEPAMVFEALAAVCAF